MSVFIVSLLASYLFGLIQFQDILVFFGVKANLLLALGIAYGILEENWLRRIFLTFSITGIISFYIIPDGTLFIFAAGILLGFALIDYLPWAKEINGTVAIILITLALNLDAVSIIRISIASIINVGSFLAIYKLIKYIDGKLNPYRYL